MIDVVVNIQSSKGDEYRVRLTSAGEKYLSAAAIRKIGGVVSVVTIELERIQGTAVSGHAVLAQIENVVAQVFLQNPNVVICFICDFLSPIPASRKAMPPQQYRSLLFEKMFERYVSVHHINGVVQSVLAINGDGEKHFIHLMARSCHIQYVNIISEDLRTSFEK